MNNRIRILTTSWMAALVMALSSVANAVPIPAETATSDDFMSTPPLLTRSAVPLVMLAMSADHQLFSKAYLDYTDIDGDGVIDTKYTDSFAYAGYFDNSWCYIYSSTNNVFTPSRQVRGVADGSNHYCDQTDSGNKLWSGNFLNWATMTRIDIIRHTLYGGKRIQVSGAQGTVLERSYLPEDAHAFAKVYTGSDLKDLTPYSSSVTLCNVSIATDGAPLLRIRSSADADWALGEVRQCASSGSETDLYVRVERCVANEDADTSETCQVYPNSGTAVSKPVGLLQNYGAQGNIKFGLISGSYEKPHQGGVVRKNIGMMSDEIDSETGEFTSTSGIIGNIDRFSIVNYDHADAHYDDCSARGISVSSYLAGLSTTKCRNWGNPVAEIYLEALRYLSGDDPTPEYDADDSAYGLTAASWTDPLAAENICASCTIVVLGSGNNSFDSIGAIASVTNEVGDIELSGSYITSGIAETDSAQYCNAGGVADLSSKSSMCATPELQGSYDIAGLAYYAKINDIRSDTLATKNVTTYAMEMGDNHFAVPGTAMRIVPVCEFDATGTGSYQPCSLIGVRFEDGSDENSGAMHFYWEDSLFGWNYDLDARQEISYCVGSACGDGVADGQVRITNSIPYNSSPDVRISYAISGTTSDGLNTNSWLDAQGSAIDPPVASLYTISDSPARFLNSPLWYAAKFGGFTDLDGDGTPVNVSGGSQEWDVRNNRTGEYVADGIPDNYFSASNPGQLRNQLSEVFDNVVSRTTSGTNAAVVSSSNTGVGAIYQALYQPRINYGNNTVTWSGYMHSLFIDGKGRVREDSNGNQRLDASDSVVDIYFEPSVERTLLQRKNPSTDANVGSPLPIDELEPIWDARIELAKMSNADAGSQRPFDQSDSSRFRRHLLTPLGTNQDGSASLVDFTDATFTSTDNFYEYLAVPQTEAAALINYIRGDDRNTSYRTRTIDFKKTGTPLVWRLGDVIHSTPEIVGLPEGNYHVTQQDPTFASYWQAYKNRRQMVYVGSNGGMLHGFNGGFWNSNDQSFDKQFDGEAAHELGAEIWGYVPKQVLPHLRWLAEANYPHTYYVDGEPISFDANIFTPDATHPDGWGTVLVIGMRLGGGPQTVTRSDGQVETFRSGYIVLDVTDPESPPVLIAEISHDQLGFTTSKPALVKARVPAVIGTGKLQGTADWSQAPAMNKWYLALGSGPTELATAASDQGSKLFLYDLANKQFVTDGTGNAAFNTGESSSYLGDLTVVDWNGDNVDDVIYFGTSSVDANNAVTGNLKRLVLDWGTTELASVTGFSTLIETNQPIVAEPYYLTDAQRRNWVYAGTGRLMVAADNRNSQQQSFYGVKEPLDSSDGSRSYGTVLMDDIRDNTSVVVFTDLSIKDSSSGSLQSVVSWDGNTTLNNLSELITEMNDWSGWMLNLDYDGTKPAGRNLSASARLFNTIFFTEYLPPEQQCDIDGRSYMNGVDYRTGTASTMSPFGYEDRNYPNNVIIDRLDIGTGLASAPVIHRGGDGTTNIITQKSTGEIGTDLVNVTSNGGRMSWYQIF